MQQCLPAATMAGMSRPWLGLPDACLRRVTSQGVIVCFVLFCFVIIFYFIFILYQVLLKGGPFHFSFWYFSVVFWQVCY